MPVVSQVYYDRAVAKVSEACRDRGVRGVPWPRCPGCCDRSVPGCVVTKVSEVWPSHDQWPRCVVTEVTEVCHDRGVAELSDGAVKLSASSTAHANPPAHPPPPTRNLRADG